MSFGNVLVGGTGSLTSQAVATVTGAGGTTLSISSPTTPFTGSSLTGSITGTGTSSFTSNFTFAPLSTGAATPQALTISDSGGGTTAKVTLTGTGVAPLETITTSNPYLLVGTSGTINLNVANIGNGNLAGVSSASNLNGTVGSASSVFVGTGGAFHLQDATSTSASATTQSFAFTYTPSTKGAVASSTVVTTFTNGVNTNGTGTVNNTNSSGSVSTLLTATGVAPVASVSNTGTVIGRVGTTLNSTVTIANTGNGNLSGLGTVSNLRGAVSNTLGSGVSASAGNPSSVSLTDSSSTTLAYTYTPISRGTVSSTATIAFANGNANGSNATQTVSSVFVNQAVGPQFSSASSVSGGSVTPLTPVAVANGSIGSASSTISFGTVGFKKSVTVYLELANITTDPGSAAQTELTIEKYSIAGANASSFTPSLTFGSIITEGGQLLVPITVTNTTGYGVLNSSLTIFTDESAALGGTGDTFTYALTAMAVPEPASVAVLGAGLAGLLGLRRRRRVD